MTHFNPIQKEKVHNGYLCYTPAHVRGKTIFLQCHIINLISPNFAEIEMVSDPLKARNMVELKDLYDMIAV